MPKQHLTARIDQRLYGRLEDLAARNKTSISHEVAKCLSAQLNGAEDTTPRLDGITRQLDQQRSQLDAIHTAIVSASKTTLMELGELIAELIKAPQPRIAQPIVPPVRHRVVDPTTLKKD